MNIISNSTKHLRICSVLLLKERLYFYFVLLKNIKLLIFKYPHPAQYNSHTMAQGWAKILNERFDLLSFVWDDSREEVGRERIEANCSSWYVKHHEFSALDFLNMLQILCFFFALAGSATSKSGIWQPRNTERKKWRKWWWRRWLLKFPWRIKIKWWVYTWIKILCFFCTWNLTTNKYWERKMKKMMEKKVAT
jgi:hypothetical protein